jgi:hypothetical protein
MILPDDSSITLDQLKKIRKHAKNALNAAGAVGRYPTPVSDVMGAARLLISDEPVLDESFIVRMSRKAGKALKRALTKVIGLFDVVARLVYIDRGVLLVRQTFLKLHETGHAVLPWQRDLYNVIQDCEKTISPEISEAFDREANVFASEVLFQLDDFTKRAADVPFGIRVPIDLSKHYGASIYATIRRYVSTSHRACAVLVINPPEPLQGEGFVATLRRVVPSINFKVYFGSLKWPEQFTPSDEIGAMIPVGKRRMSKPRTCSLRDGNGYLHECIAEAFTTTYQVFILIHAVATLNRKTIILP